MNREKEIRGQQYKLILHSWCRHYYQVLRQHFKENTIHGKVNLYVIIMRERERERERESRGDGLRARKLT